MQQIVNFIIRNKTFLLFLLLFSISIFFTVQSHSYHKSKFINSANFLTGGVYNSINNISEYFHLKSQNEILAKENNRLKAILYNSQTKRNTSYIDSVTFNALYKFRTAQVIKNSYNATNNVLLVNRGIKDHIKQDFGVITDKGILGIVDQTSKNYATVLSVLNSKSNISAQLKNSNHFGTLKWDGKSHVYTQLIDIAKNAILKKGDTIITSGRSSIFPKGVLVGTINDFKLDPSENSYIINIKLFNDMANIEHVYIIENVNLPEIKKLLNE
ncbi:rod shape-determining protein MreC [Confluentibacter lentus]|uniref:rod shape-determining protein MreC n=1 Tax=Confluentibacter lentus TaxID=1699412 RepID=UPI000C2858EE|nr:rod shape-determining protein MreC [Confluentibacter lentus]